MKQATSIQTLLGILTLLGAIVLTGCGSSNGDTTSQTSFNNGSGDQPYKPVTHLTHRSIVSNYYTASLDVMDATQNRLTNYAFPVGGEPTYLQPSPDGTLTFVNNTGSGSISSFNNNLEAVKATIALGGFTESFVTSVSNEAGFAAVPNISNGNPPAQPGGIVRFNPTDGSLNTDIPFPNIEYLALDTAELHLLAFTNVDNNAHWVDLTTDDPNLGVPPYYTLTLSGNAVPISHPVAAFFSSDNTKAYILSCGYECGGTSSASVTEIDTTSIKPPTTLTAGTVYTGTTLSTPVTVLHQWTVNGARIGVIDLTANNLYLAGSTTASTAFDCPFADLNTPACAQNNGGNDVQDGYFTVINLAAGTAGPAIRVGNGAKKWIRNINGVFWVASLNCGVENCVSLVNPTAATATVLASANGDATGISFQANSGDVYTIEGGFLNIYDQNGNPVSSQYPTDVHGQASDVLYID